MFRKYLSEYQPRGRRWVSSLKTSEGSRVPVKTLFSYLEDNYTLEEFLECFPSVTREAARAVLERCESALIAPTPAAA